ncbi:MAG: hypothetical protein WBP29_15280 [Candidatus Zixiibacteriota bacterium]
MSKIDNLLLILHLFLTRRSVSLDLIIERCHISQRTAFRYLRSMEGAGFPLLFDKEMGGYHLVNRSGALAHLTPTELSAVYLGVDILDSLLSPTQMEVFRRVKLKLESYMTREVQNELTTLMRSLAIVSDGEKVRDHLIISFLKSAQMQQKRIRLYYRDGKAGIKITELSHPTLQFEREWRLRSELDGQQPAVPLSNIVDIEILNEK